MITLVIPVLNQYKHTNILLSQVSRNTIVPEKIIIIDNGSTENIKNLCLLHKKQNNLNIHYIRHDKNIGVNPAWNEGIKLAKTPYISIFNNDIRISEYLFEKIIKSFKIMPQAGIVVPETIKKKVVEINDTKAIPRLMDMGGSREGWAFTIKKQITDQIQPIPDSFKIYCGDDYLFWNSRKLGFKNYRIKNCKICHIQSATIRSKDKIETEGIDKERYNWLVWRRNR